MRVIFAFFVNTLCNFAIGLLVAKFLGPEEFGRFALALAIGVVLQTAVFDWIRLSSIRFYSARSRAERPELRATLDLTFGAIAAAVAVAAVGLMLSGVSFSLSSTLLGLAAALSIANGLFDYQTALVRARFDDHLYGRMILSKNLLALVVTAGGAYLFASAQTALIGVCISMAGSVLAARRDLHDPGAETRNARRAIAAECLRYSLPIIAANVLYNLIPLANRALVARWEGFSETGQFSLSFDLGTRVIAAIGTALDVLLFQIAVRADEKHGADEGQEQVARNMGLVFAVMAPTCAGVWLTLPSLEALVVPMEYRGPFEYYFSLLLAGFFAFGMINFAVNPVFQITKRTLPLIAAAGIACIADAALIVALPRNATSLAIAQSGSLLCGLAALMVFAGLSGARWPRGRDPALAAIAAGVMVAALAPLRRHDPGVVTLLTQAAAGVAIYGGFIALFDIAGLRGILLDFLKTLRAPRV